MHVKWQKNLAFAKRYGTVGLLLGLFAFLFNYYYSPVSLSGYEILAAPAMFALQFISHETAFWPKLAVFLFEQYLGSVLILFVVKLLISLAYQRRN